VEGAHVAIALLVAVAVLRSARGGCLCCMFWRCVFHQSLRVPFAVVAAFVAADRATVACSRRVLRWQRSRACSTRSMPPPLWASSITLFCEGHCFVSEGPPTRGPSGSAGVFPPDFDAATSSPRFLMLRWFVEATFSRVGGLGLRRGLWKTTVASFVTQIKKKNRSECAKRTRRAENGKAVAISVAAPGTRSGWLAVDQLIQSSHSNKQYIYIYPAAIRVAHSLA
jgi:hypothetical protein